MSADRGDCPDCGALVGYEDHAPDCPASDTPAGDEAPSEPSCGGCRFYSRIGDAIDPSKGPVPGGHGECRRYAPRPGAETWPGVRGTDLCGEFDWREEPEGDQPPAPEWDPPFRRGATIGPALPPRECPCDEQGKLPIGMKQHLTSCRWISVTVRTLPAREAGLKKP